MSVRDRFNQYLKSKHLSQNEFAEICGLNRSVASRLSEATSESTLRKISEATDLNVDWLINGEGEMLKDDFAVPDTEYNIQNDNSKVLIPLVHIDSVGGVWSPNKISSSEQYIERLVPFPDARPGDLAILQSGNSMSPTIPAGAILQIRQVQGWREYFGYGGDFVLWLNDERRITKQVLKYDPDPRNYVTCHSYNPEVGDEELPKSMIVEVWKVINVLINKGW